MVTEIYYPDLPMGWIPRAEHVWTITSTTSYTIYSFGLFGYLRPVCLLIISTELIPFPPQLTMLDSQISLILFQQTSFVLYTRYVNLALLDSLDLTH
jgi:hypothetical protein